MCNVELDEAMQNRSVEALEELVRNAQKAARKAARHVVKLAAAEDVDAEELATAQKAARKAERRVAKLAAAAAAEDEVAEELQLAQEPAAEEVAAAAKAAKKAAKHAAQQEANAEGKTGKKRSADEGAESDTTVASSSDQKRRKDADGLAVATKVLGAKAFCAAHQIVAYSGCPDPMETFDAAALALGEKLTKALRSQGYMAPTPIQAQGWPVALEGRDLVAVAKTGSGKTCGFLLPALVRIAERGPQRTSGFNRMSKPTCLVLAPTRELVQQIAGEAEKFAPFVAATVCVLYGGVPKSEQCFKAKQGADIVIATPGRLLDLAGGDPSRSLPPVVSLENVNYLVLDEADRMLDMGFEPDIRKIAGQCKESGRSEEGGGAAGALGGTKRQTLFFTATWPKNVQRTARSLTSCDALNICIGQGADGDKLSANPMVKQTLLMVEAGEKSQKLHEVLKAELGKGQSCVVFSSMKVSCDSLERQIQKQDYGFDEKPWCRVIHSGREQWERDESLQQFRAVTAGKQGADKRAILIATDVAARGLDIPGVAMVVVYDFGRSKKGDDSSVESYVHRIGRTGRAGKTGKAFTFFTAEDSGALELVEVLDGAKQDVPAQLRELADYEWHDRNRRKGKGKKGGKGGKGGKSGKGGKGKSKGSKGSKGKW